MRAITLLFTLFLTFRLDAIPFEALKEKVDSIKNPFSYHLNLNLLRGTTSDAPVLLLLHGMGGDQRLAQIVRSYGAIPDHLISFNFPDAGLNLGQYDSAKMTFGTIEELLPFLYLLKKLVVDEGLDAINVYGFSAGAGALVNGIAVLNSDLYHQQLQALGITSEDRKTILEALQRGTLLLDVPLKSLREIIAFRGSHPALLPIARRYRDNNFEPIDSLQEWNGLALHVIVYFEIDDEVLSNRDDALFAQRLQAVNSRGSVQIVRGRDGGHISYHRSLWKAYIKAR